LSSEQARALYGSGYERLGRARARVDLRGILNPNGVADVAPPAASSGAAHADIPLDASQPVAPAFSLRSTGGTSPPGQ
jgi:hypothetical protein